MSGGGGGDGGGGGGGGGGAAAALDGRTVVKDLESESPGWFNAKTN